ALPSGVQSATCIRQPEQSVRGLPVPVSTTMTSRDVWYAILEPSRERRAHTLGPPEVVSGLVSPVSRFFREKSHPPPAPSERSTSVRRLTAQGGSPNAFPRRPGAIRRRRGACDDQCRLPRYRDSRPDRQRL